MALKARADLVNDALANLGIVQQTDAGTPAERESLVGGALAHLGIVYQTDASATRTRAEWVTETLSILGVIQQTDAGTTRVRADWVNAVAYALGPGAIGQTLDAENYAFIDGRLPGVVADLNARVIATVSNIAAIPAAWFDSLTVIAANTLKDAYGVTGDEAAKLASEAQLAEKKLRTLSRTGLVDEILPSLIGELNARGIATITISAIPGAWFASLADIAAERVKGKFEIDAARSQEIAARALRAESTLKNLTRATLVDSALPSIMANLNARGIATVSDLTAIPAAWLSPLIDIVADRVRPICDVAPEIAKQVAENVPHAERMLKNLTRTYLVDRAIDQILAELVADEFMNEIDVTEIPDEIYPALASIVANKCKGRFELDALTLQRVTAEGAQAETTLRRISRSGPSYLVQTGAYF